MSNSEREKKIIQDPYHPRRHRRCRYHCWNRKKRFIFSFCIPCIDSNTLFFLKIKTLWAELTQTGGYCLRHIRLKTERCTVSLFHPFMCSDVGIERWRSLTFSLLVPADEFVVVQVADDVQDVTGLHCQILPTAFLITDYGRLIQNLYLAVELQKLQQLLTTES